MSVTLLIGDQAASAPSARVLDDRLWLSAADLHKASGWKLEPQGLCRGDACVQVRPEWRNADDEIDFTAFAAHMGQSVIHDDSGELWSVSESSAALTDAMHSVEAPDFELPDLDGKMHALSSFRGKKVFLYSWGSY